jgi:hypothetical protein
MAAKKMRGLRPRVSAMHKAKQDRRGQKATVRIGKHVLRCIPSKATADTKTKGTSGRL